MAEIASKRKLEDLRVVDLRAELEKLGLDQKGVKATLTDRLKQALIDQKLDPDTHEFTVDENSAAKKATPKPNKMVEKEELMEAEGEEEEEQVFESLADLVESDHDEAGEEFEFGESLTVKKSQEDEQKEETEEAKKDDHVTTAAETPAPATAAPPTTKKDDDHVTATAPSESTNQKGGGQQKEAESAVVEVDLDGGDSEKQEQQDHVPNPENVEPQFAFTAEDTIKMHQVTADQSKQAGKNNVLNDDASSMFVNADETMSDLDASSDLAPSSVANDSTSPAAQPAQGQPQPQAAAKTTDSGAQKPPQFNEFLTQDTNSTQLEGAVVAVEDKNKTAPAPVKNVQEKVAEPPTATNLAKIDAREEANPTKTGGQTAENTGDSAKSEAKKLPEVKKEPSENATPKDSTTPVAKKVEAKLTESSESLCKSVWVIGISSTIKAADLKSVFSKYGRVVTAKVMSSKSKSDGSRWYGFVTMASSEEASKCIQHLHRTELHGKMISVERATDPKGNMVPPKKAIAAANAAAAPSAAVAAAAPDGATGQQSEAQKQPAESATSESGATTDAAKQAESAEKTEKSADQETTKKPEQQEPSTENADQQKSSATAPKTDASTDKKKEGEKSKDTKSGDKKSRSPRSERDRSRRSRERRERDDRDRRRDFALRSSRAGRRGGPFRPGYSGRGGGRPPIRRNGGPPSTRPSYPRGGGSSMRGGRGGPPIRRVDPAVEFERRRRENEMLERLRQKEAEHRQREEMLRLQREKERLRFEREKLEREKLELQHQHQQMRLQVAYERSLPIQQTQPMLGVKRAYEGLGAFSGPPEPKRPAYGPSSMPPGGSRSNGRARTPPRNYPSGGRDSYRGSNGRYDSSRDSRSNRNRPSDSYRDRSSSSRRPEDSGGRSSRPLPSGSGGGGSRRSYPSPGGRRTGGRDDPPPPPPRQSWGGGASGGGASSGGRHSGGGMGRGGSDRDLGGPYGGGSRGNVSNNASSAGVWSADNALPSNANVWSRTGMPAQVSTALWSAPQTSPMYGSVGNAGGSNSYVSADRFDAYKYPMSSTRRY